jgi:hypothetical protein
MTAEPVPLAALEAAREKLVAKITGEMPEAHKQFLLGFKRGTPDWELIGLPDAADLPAVKWKQLNLDKLSESARTRLVDQLTAALALGSIATEG